MYTKCLWVGFEENQFDGKSVTAASGTYFTVWLVVRVDIHVRETHQHFTTSTHRLIDSHALYGALGGGAGGGNGRVHIFISNSSTRYANAARMRNCRAAQKKKSSQKQKIHKCTTTYV